jgi:hypothetical protein
MQGREEISRNQKAVGSIGNLARAVLPGFIAGPSSEAATVATPLPLVAQAILPGLYSLDLSAERHLKLQPSPLPFLGAPISRSAHRGTLTPACALLPFSATSAPMR